MPPKRNKNAPVGAIIIWVILALICIQGYFLIQKKSRPAPPVAKPVAKAVSVKKTLPVAVKPSPRVTPAAEPGPLAKPARIAIVIDDWGYNRAHCKQLEDLPVSVGVAILPGLTYSRDIIACAASSGKEPMLHLPIEPHNPREKFTEDYLLTTDMGPSALKKSLAKTLTEMQGVVGVNNHTGSKGTEDDALMTIILAELKRRGLFFVDSYTSEKSICEAVARKIKMKIARRNVFLDNRNERAYIERQFAIAARMAKRDGYALVIGHDRALTLQIIAEQVKKLGAQGYEFITVKEYIKQHAYSGN